MALTRPSLWRCVCGGNSVVWKHLEDKFKQAAKAKKDAAAAKEAKAK